MEGQRKYLISQKHFSASGCPHANKNRARSIETSLGMGAGGLLKYGGLIKPSIHSVPYPAPPGSTDVCIFILGIMPPNLSVGLVRCLFVQCTKEKLSEMILMP